jgi:hypothetical protein
MPSSVPFKSSEPSSLPSAGPSKSSEPSSIPSAGPSEFSEPSTLPSSMPSESSEPSWIPSSVPWCVAWAPTSSIRRQLGSRIRRWHSSEGIIDCLLLGDELGTEEEVPHMAW